MPPVRTMLPVRRLIIEEMLRGWSDRSTARDIREVLEGISNESLVETFKHYCSRHEPGQPVMCKVYVKCAKPSGPIKRWRLPSRSSHKSPRARP